MSIQKRKTLYYIFALVFVVFGTYLIITTQGMVFDWKTLQLVKTGGIYLKFVPSDATVYVNGEPTNKTTGILNRGIMLGKLLPHIYHVSVRKDGYVPWEKDLKVDEGIFTAASAIHLWKEIPEKEIVATSTTSSVTLVQGGVIEKKGKKILFSGNELRGSYIRAAREDSNLVITEDNEKTLFLIDTLHPETAINIGSLFTSLRAQQIEHHETSTLRSTLIHPFSNEKIIAASEYGIYVMDLKKISIEKIAEGTSTIAHLINVGNEVFGISNSGHVIGAHLLLLSSFSFDLGIGSSTLDKITISESGEKIAFTDTAGTLFLYDRERNSTSVLSKNVLSFAVSPDGTKAAWIDEKKHISIYYAEKEKGDLKFERGSTSSIEIAPGDITKKTTLFWLSEFPSHLFLNTFGKIVVVEIDPRGATPNEATLTEASSQVIITKDALYTIDEDKENGFWTVSRLIF